MAESDRDAPGGGFAPGDMPGLLLFPEVFALQPTKIVPVDKLTPLNLRPVLGLRVGLLKASIQQKGYDPACPLVVQTNGKGYLVVNGCHRLQAVRELNLREIPVVEYPVDEDPVRLALRTQENDEGVQPWDFLDRALLVKRLYSDLGTLDAVAQKLGWKDKSSAHHYLNIANLPEDALTEIRNSVNQYSKEAVNGEVDGRQLQNLDDVWKSTWFRHICALPTDELKLAVVRRIAEPLTLEREGRCCRAFPPEKATRAFACGAGARRLP